MLSVSLRRASTTCKASQFLLPSYQTWCFAPNNAMLRTDPSPYHTFSTSACPRKSLANCTDSPSPLSSDTSRHSSPRGLTTHAEDVVEGRARGRTLKAISLAGKVCVVTSPLSSISALFCRTLVEAGANSIALLFSTRPDAEKAAKELIERCAERKWEGVKVLSLVCDFEAEKSLEEMVRKVEATFARIDVLCVNDLLRSSPSPATSPAVAISSLVRIVAASMTTNSLGGSIILVETRYGPRVDLPQPQPRARGHLAGPGGETSRLAATLGAEWAKRGVRVNCIAPGFIETGGTKCLLAEDHALQSTWESLTPLGRIGSLEDLKGAVVLFSCDASRFTVGTTLTVDGGYSLV